MRSVFSEYAADDSFCGKSGSPRKAADALERRQFTRELSGRRTNNSLFQLGGCFTPNAVAALEIRLVVGEEECTASKRVLLENPAATAQIVFQDVLLEVIDDFTYIVRISAVISRRKWQMLPAVAFSQESREVVTRAVGSNNAVGAAVDVLHARGFRIKVSAFTLDNTERINP